MDIEKVIEGLINASKQMQNNWPHSDLKPQPDERNELICLKLYDIGWKQDGFEHVPDSYDIITYWKKDGENERKQVRLTFSQQRRWVRELEKRKKENKI